MVKSEIAVLLEAGDYDAVAEGLNESNDLMSSIFSASDPLVFLNVALALRRLRDNAEIAFFLFLEAWEASSKWTSLSRNGSFEGILHDQNICKPSRFRDWCKERPRLTSEQVARLGVGGVIAVSKLADNEKHNRAVAEIEDHFIRRGVPVSAQQAEKIVGHIQPPVPAFKSRNEQQVAVADRLRIAERDRNKFERELKAALGRIAELETKIVALKTENNRLRRGVKKTEKSAEPLAT
jgi:hypothetical protein